MNEKLEKWQRWLEVILQEMRHQAVSRAVYYDTLAIVDANPAIPRDSTFFDFLEQWYVDSTVMALRRQLKVDTDSVSLAAFLQDVAANPHLLSRVRFVALCPASERDQAEAVFTGHWGSGATHVASDAVTADLAKLKEASAGCEKYADRLVAHRDKRGLSVVPTHEELDKAIAVAHEILLRYYPLLHGERLTRVTAVFTENWKRVFKVPWTPG